MESGQEAAAITAGVSTTAGIAVVALPSTGVGPLDTLSLLGSTILLSLLVISAAIFMLLAVRLFLRARMG